MIINEVTYTPTTHSVERKNTKYFLAHAVVEVWREIQDCKDEEAKDRIIKILLSVL